MKFRNKTNLIISIFSDVSIEAEISRNVTKHDKNASKLNSERTC